MKNHISISQIKMYLRCPLQYKFRYIDDLIIPPTSTLTLGKSIHATLETNYSQKIKTKEDLPLGYVMDIFSDTWNKEAENTQFEENEKPGQVKDEGIGLLGLYHAKISPKIQPKYVEKEFELGFDNVPYTLKGYIDLVDQDQIIIDHKTTKRSMAEDSVSKDLQLTCYALGYRTTTGEKETQLRLDIMVRNKQPKLQQLQTIRTEEDISRFLKIVAYVSKAIHSGIFYPNENFMCSICGYKDLCRKW